MNDREFSENELRLLRFLWQQGRATLPQLAEALHPLPPTAVQHLVNGLVKEGFVTCDRSGKEAAYALVEDTTPPSEHGQPKPRPTPGFLGNVLHQFGPAANAVVTAAGAAVAHAAANAARKAIAEAAAGAVTNATAAGGKAVGSFLKSAGKAALGKVTSAKKADQVVEQIADTAADIGKQVSDSVAGVVAKIVTEAMKQHHPADDERRPHNGR